jgi:hypothetical protein
MAAIGNDPVSLRQVTDALRLIATTTPVTLRQIRTLMRGIVIGPLYGARGQWRESIRICVLSTEYLMKERPSAVAIAATIVHELAHARLDARGIAWTAERAGRIERICFRASQRFLNTLPASPDRDTAMDELDEYLSFDTAVWRVLVQHDYRPWYIRAFAYFFRRIGQLWDRAAPT